MEPNAFAPEFLDHFAEHDEPATGLEASTSGPWRVLALDLGRWGVIQEGEVVPHAVLKDRELALLAAAILPATGRDVHLVLSDKAEAQGFPISALGQGSRPETVGWLASFDPEMLVCLHSGLHLALSPSSLALLLEAAGSTALRRAGVILADRLKARTGEEKAGEAQGEETPAEG